MWWNLHFLVRKVRKLGIIDGLYKGVMYPSTKIYCYLQHQTISNGTSSWPIIWYCEGGLLFWFSVSGNYSDSSSDWAHVSLSCHLWISSLCLGQVILYFFMWGQLILLYHFYGYVNEKTFTCKNHWTLYGFTQVLMTPGLYSNIVHLKIAHIS